MIPNEKLRDSLEELMKLSLEKLDSERRNFYPLAAPTYGADEVLGALDSMVTFKTTMWEKVAEFERRFGDKFGGEAIMVNSGSSADLVIALALMEKSGGSLSKGDEVLVPAVTWPTHLWSFLMAGLNVRLIDVATSSLNFDLEKIENSISERTKAISVVHLLGNIGPIKELQQLCEQRNLILLEDCCESLGSKYDGEFSGTFGLASSYSFFFSHHMVTMEGGMILTRDTSFAERCRLLRAHGWTRNANIAISDQSFENRYKFVSWGLNVRPTELQAAFGLVQLDKVDIFNSIRKSNAEFLQQKLQECSNFFKFLAISPRVNCSWFCFPILIAPDAPFSREELVRHLESRGIETRPIVAGNLAKQPAIENFPEIEFGELPGADFIDSNGLYIGLHPKEDYPRLARVVEIFEEFCLKWKK